MFRTLFLASLVALSSGGAISTLTTPAFALPAVQSSDGDDLGGDGRF